MTTFTRVDLFTDHDGRARFRESVIALDEGTVQAQLSAVDGATGVQFRHSPIGFRSAFHCSPKAQWVFVLAGSMEIGLQDGTSRIFNPGEHFFSADTLPEGATFDPAIHGHWSCQVGELPLVTLFVKV